MREGGDERHAAGAADEERARETAGRDRRADDSAGQGHGSLDHGDGEALDPPAAEEGVLVDASKVPAPKSYTTI
ncbi:hypothetical protein ABT369_34060 [Dactylosporangium sp. NPDC000244]|uniref:hypothetical protein n=1 Tax=Dactylosporangium sp. NPDC000244 TaxID=3154365 RepID=UPI00332A3D7E